MKFIKYLLTILVSIILSINLANAEKWDMALAYGAGNFHSANAAEFAKNVTEKSGGKLTIVTHPGGSLFKGGEIFRAVRTGQAQIGERFMSALGKEDPLLEVDSQPFLATSYSDAMKLYKASKSEISGNSRRNSHRVIYHQSLPLHQWPEFMQKMGLQMPFQRGSELERSKRKSNLSAHEIPIPSKIKRSVFVDKNNFKPRQIDWDSNEVNTRYKTRKIDESGLILT